MIKSSTEDQALEILYRDRISHTRLNLEKSDRDRFNSAIQECYSELPTIPDSSRDDSVRQGTWFMPDSYKELDIGEYLISRCCSDAEINRVVEELELYDKFNLFDLLRYLKYLVDVMRDNQVVWGVGRGSSVASFCLYLIGIHRINSLEYNLDIREFLREE